MALIPLERDLLSMELGATSYKDVFLDSNYDSIYEMARGLLTLQRAFGVIPRLIGKGDAARVSDKTHSHKSILSHCDDTV